MRKISALLVGCLLIFSGQAGFAQNPKLIEAAKKEGGKVIVYTTMEPFTLDAIKAAFEKRTGLQVEFWRSGITEVLTRALSEHRAGKITFDVIGMPGDHMQLMAKEGALVKYDSPSLKGFPKDAIDPILGARYRNILFGVIYNKDDIKASDSPALIKLCPKRAPRNSSVISPRRNRFSLRTPSLPPSGSAQAKRPSA